MAIVLTAPANGDVLSGPTLFTETKKIEVFLSGGIDVGDVQNTSLKRTHLYQPDSYGFPMERSDEIQTALVNRVVRDHWDPVRQTRRFDIPIPSVGEDGVASIGEGCAATFDHYGGACQYVVRCYFGVKVYDDNVPTFALTERLLGGVNLRHRDRTTGTIVTATESFRLVEPGWDRFGVSTFKHRLRGIARYTQAVFAITNEGTHDVWLEYTADATNELTLRVVAFCQRGLKISKHQAP